LENTPASMLQFIIMQEEKFPWSAIYIGTIFSLLVLGIAYYFMAPGEGNFFSEERTEKITEFSNSFVSGRKDGNKVWSFFVAEGWTGKGHEVSSLTNLSQGKIYSDGKLVATNISAPFAKTYRHSEIIELYGFFPNQQGGSSKLTALIELGRISNNKDKAKNEWRKLTADRLKHFPWDKRSEIIGNVVLSRKDNSLHAQSINVDHEKKIADLTGNIAIVRSDSTLKTEGLRYLTTEEVLTTTKEITLEVREAETTTILEAKGAEFYSDLDKDITFENGVEVLQGKKFAIANQAIYSQKSKVMLLKGKAKIVFEKANIIIKEETANKLKNPESQKSLKEKTIITADQLTFSTTTGDLKAAGSVFAYQQGKEAKSDTAIYNEKDEFITLTGNVYIKKKTDWVKAKKVIISVKDETFEAVGGVEAEFKL